MPTDREWRRIERDHADQQILRRAAAWLRQDPGRAEYAGLSRDHDALALAELLDVLATALPDVDQGAVAGRGVVPPAARRADGVTRDPSHQASALSTLFSVDWSTETGEGSPPSEQGSSSGSLCVLAAAVLWGRPERRRRWRRRSGRSPSGRRRWASGASCRRSPHSGSSAPTVSDWPSSGGRWRWPPWRSRCTRWRSTPRCAWPGSRWARSSPSAPDPSLRR